MWLIVSLSWYYDCLIEIEWLNWVVEWELNDCVVNSIGTIVIWYLKFFNVIVWHGR